jgi:hypothetical protein
MNEYILNKTKEICDKQMQASIKNWHTNSFSPAHSYDYMFMCVFMDLFKKELNKK